MKKTLKQKIEEIELQGYEVEIQHNRNSYLENIAAKGGYTVATIKNDSTIANGTSFCSDKDNYNKKIGALIALGRAEKKLKRKLDHTI